jgi:hypothetical protein
MLRKGAVQMKADSLPEKEKGELVEYIPPIQEQPGMYAEGKRIHASAKRRYVLQQYRKISQMDSGYPFGLV